MQDSKADFRGKLVLLGASIAVIFTALEVREPVFLLGPVGFTTSELAAVFFFATMAVWVLGQDVSQVLKRRALDVAVVLFVLSNFISAAFNDNLSSTLKFSLRMTFAALLYFGISRLPPVRRSHRVVVGTLSAVIVVISIIGILEGLFTSLPWHKILGPFREETVTFAFFYNVRVSSTLPFPTVFSIFIELAMPVVLAMGLWLVGRQEKASRRKLLWLILLLVLALIIAVQILTYTRSSYAVTPIALIIGAIAALIFGYERRVAAVFAIGALLMVVTVGTSALFSDRMASRLGLSEQTARYDAEYILLEMPSSLAAGSSDHAVVLVRNTGADAWETGGSGGANLSYRWLGYPDGEKIDIPIRVTDLPHEIGPGDEVELDVEFQTPEEPGRYILAFELAAASCCWFSDTGVAPLVIPIEFNEATGRTFTIKEPPTAFNSTAPPPMSTPRTQLWRAAFNAWQDYPVLGMGPDQFRKRWPDYIPGAEPDERLGSHNIFLEAMANTGIIGLAALIYLLARTAWVQLRLVRNRGLDWEFRLLALGLLVSTAVYIGHGMFEYPLWQTGVTFLLFILLGLTTLLDTETGGGSKKG